jgi:hypothetical protein
MLALLGPVSSASPNGQGPFFSWFLIIVGGFVVVSVIFDNGPEYVFFAFGEVLYAGGSSGSVAGLLQP